MDSGNTFNVIRSQMGAKWKAGRLPVRFPPQHADICQASAFLVKGHQKVAHIPDAVKRARGIYRATVT